MAIRRCLRRGVDAAGEAITAVDSLATVAEETSSWPYQHDRDLTGFINGTENPSRTDAPEVAVIPDREAGAGGTTLLLQNWAYDASAWESLSVERQELVIGRAKPDSVELEDGPADSHVARTDQDRFGKVFRRTTCLTARSLSTALCSLGFSAEQHRLAAMLESMAGLTDGAMRSLRAVAGLMSASTTSNCVRP